jgi:hypothetical protein
MIESQVRMLLFFNLNNTLRKLWLHLEFHAITECGILPLHFTLVAGWLLFPELVMTSGPWKW